ncbi:DUF3298 domain-containing protein [Rummeliibacillus sp. NPDC094406]|uniref:DUF3298 and DUF4163 domain-containing protein n=1 Tax=Rummeliibacillus sp. NPDC094406 TaxID=3364511 RepID=UPI0037FA0C53
MDKKLKELQNQYESIPIPDNLDEVVEMAIKNGKKKKTVPRWLFSTVAAVAIFTVGVNISPAMAQTLDGIPVINKVAKILTFREYKVKDETYEADIKVPNIKGLNDDKLESKLNEKYIEDGKKLYSDFKGTVADIKKNGGGHYGVESGYSVKTNDEKLVSIGRYVVNTVGSSSTTMKYDTIDKENKVVLSLPMLFKDDAYIKTISNYIEEQMKKEMKESNMDKTYWVQGVDGQDFGTFDGSKNIKPNHNFYINKHHQLVIAFDKYEVAPGYMGLVEFKIPTKIIQKDLVSNQYIKK